MTEPGKDMVTCDYILWMEEILHHQKDGWNPKNNGVNHLSTGAGFRNHPQYDVIKNLYMWKKQWT